MVCAGGVEEQEDGSAASTAAAAAAPAPAAVVAVARAARPPRPGSRTGLGVRHPLKHRRFLAVAKMVADARARGLGEATVVAALAAPRETEREDEPANVCGGWQRDVIYNNFINTMMPTWVHGIWHHQAPINMASLEDHYHPSQTISFVCPEKCMVCSEDGRLHCGYSSLRGRRASMEDFYDIRSSKIDDKDVNFFGVFDGHGGTRAAEYLKEHLFENLLKHPAFISDTKSAISETYKKTDSDFLDAEINSHREDGSTASTAVFVGNHLYVANVGDSRAVISKAGKAIALSDDHKPNRSDEQKRIEDAGGAVTWSGTWRVGGILAMSRAFGNRLLKFKQFIVADPEIQDQEIDGESEFLILASDGLWDVVPNEHAVAFVKEEDGPEAAARKLTEIAFKRGSTDNITCIVVEFRHDKMGNVSPPSTNQS
ncbi:hypothetical protein ACP4OV_027411 [Aristida adscensionis]